MYYLSDICFVCFKDVKNLKTVYLNSAEDSTVKQIIYVLPEIMLESDIPTRICSTCHRNLLSFCKFKKLCIENYGRLKEYTKLLQGSNLAKNQIPSILLINNDLTNDGPEDQKKTHFINEEDTSDIKEYIDIEKRLQQQLLSPEEYIKQVQKIKVNDDLTNERLEEQNDETHVINEEGTNDIKEDIDIEEHNVHHQILEQFIKQEQNKEVDDDKEDNIDIKEDTDIEENNVYQQLLFQYVKQEKKKEKYDDLTNERLKEQNDSINEDEERNLDLQLLLDIQRECKNDCFSNVSEDGKLAQNENISNNHIDHEHENGDNLVCKNNVLNKTYSSEDMNEEPAMKEKNSFKCKICNRIFRRKGSFNKHFCIKDLECSVCNKKFATGYSVKLHTKVVHNSFKNIECFICNKKFADKRYYNRHKRIHVDGKYFQCSICNKKFPYKSPYNVHMKLHADIRDFACSICNKKFTLKCHYNQHMKTHTGIKDFGCSVCNKKFLRRTQYKLHQKVHAGVADFECSICNKMCTRKDHWKVHNKIECSICNKTFILKKNYIWHMTKHAGIKDF